MFIPSNRLEIYKKGKLTIRFKSIHVFQEVSPKRRDGSTKSDFFFLNSAQKLLYGMNQEINSLFLSYPLKGAKES